MGTAIKHPLPDRVKSSFVIFDIRAERQSARMSKITNDGLTRSGKGCFIAVPIWQQWALKDGNKSSVVAEKPRDAACFPLHPLTLRFVICFMFAKVKAVVAPA